MGVCKYQSTVSLVKLAGAIGRTVYILSAKNTVYVWVIRPLYIIDIYIYIYIYIDITYNLLMVNLCVKGQRGS